MPQWPIAVPNIVYARPDIRSSPETTIAPSAAAARGKKRDWVKGASVPTDHGFDGTLSLLDGNLMIPFVSPGDYIFQMRVAGLRVHPYRFKRIHVSI
jgi:hypothetical protein